MLHTGARVLFVLALVPSTALADPADDERPEGAVAASDPCPHPGDVVGRRGCPYGMPWAVEWPGVIIAFGINTRHLPGSSASRSLARVTDPNGSPGVVSTTTSGEGPSHANTVFSEHVGIAPNPFMFFAIEAEFALGGTEHLMPGEREFTADSLLAAGLRVGGKSLQLGAELAGGVRLVDYATDEKAEGVLEVRARADVFTTPWMTLGGMVGTSLIERGDWVAGLSLGIHSNAYGGM